MLCIFCAAGTALSIWVATGSLNNQHPRVLSISPIQVPAHIQVQPDSASLKSKVGDLVRLRRVVIYMDSLARSPDRAFYDSLMAAHPGLADSLAFIKSLYPELTIQN